MMEGLLEAVSALTDSPLKQAALAAFCTLWLEDPTTIICGLLIADGRMTYTAAILGLSLGITVGDLGLYVIGRFLGPAVVKWGWVSQERLDHTKPAINRNLVWAVALSRFLPGTRIPTFMGAGVFGASAVKFLLTAICASLLWTSVLLHMVVRVGEAIHEYLGEFKTVGIGFAIIALLSWSLWRMVKNRRKVREEMGPHPPPVASSFEFWPPWLFYIPVGIYYAWLVIRYRSVTLPSLANPSIYSGGICRESKSQILGLVPPPQSQWVAKFATCTVSGRQSAVGSEALDGALRAMEAAGIAFPIVAKPDQGQRGAGVQLVRDAGALAAYLKDFPAEIPVVLQELADFPHEAGVLFYRKPSETAGQILSITLKEFPKVVGDGAHTLRELIHFSPRLRMVEKVFHKRHAGVLDRVLEDGEAFPLVFAGNHCQGAIFRDGTDKATPALTARMQEISDAMPDFFFGRYDLRFRDLESLQRGEGFLIVEINGASAESTHIWDPNMTILEAYTALFKQFDILFEIGAENRRRGLKPIGPLQVLRDFRDYLALSKKYPATS